MKPCAWKKNKKKNNVKILKHGNANIDLSYKFTSKIRGKRVFTNLHLPQQIRIFCLLIIQKGTENRKALLGVSATRRKLHFDRYNE